MVCLFVLCDDDDDDNDDDGSCPTIVEATRQDDEFNTRSFWMEGACCAKGDGYEKSIFFQR